MSEPLVELREIVDADLPILFAYQAEPEANEMAAFPARDEPAFREHNAKIRSDPANLLRTIAVEGRVVGSISSWTVLLGAGVAVTVIARGVYVPGLRVAARRDGR